MLPEFEFAQNLELIDQYKTLPGSVVECGVWRGGMSAAMGDLLGGERKYFLFDSFEGLPAARAIDGKAAVDWQQDKTSKSYFDNCQADIGWAQKAMKLSLGKNHTIIKGWFAATLSKYDSTNKIAILRLDGDWYDSTMDCLNHLYEHVCPGGLILLDDYYLWDGCAKAVHDFLSKHTLADRIRQYNNGNVHFIIKT